MLNRSTQYSLAAVATLIASSLALQSQAAVISFTGGNVVLHDASSQTTNNFVVWQDVDYYEEDGFRLDFFPGMAPGTSPFSTIVGDYYAGGNDVIHCHWATGDYGVVTTVEITKVGGGTFDLNYFILTSNTDFGGGAASGLEQAYVEGFVGNVSTGAPVLLPSEDWGFPATQIDLGTNFDGVDSVRFYVTNPVDCFGMDEFYIDEIPAPATIALFGGLLIGRRRRN